MIQTFIKKGIGILTLGLLLVFGGFLHAGDGKASGMNVPQKPVPKAIVKTIYLTFDDGPSSLTLKNLKTLKDADVKATFFLLPHKGEDEIYKKIVEDGHIVGSHSFAHLTDKRIFSDRKAFEKDLIHSKEFIKAKTGQDAALYRCPGGAFWRNRTFKKMLNEVMESYGMRAFDWTLSAADTDINFIHKNRKNPDVIIQKFKNNIVIGIEHSKLENIVVLMHDTPDKVYTAEAIRLAIPELKAKGYRFSTLDQFPLNGKYR